MHVGALISLIALGAGAIALWIDARFPRLAPEQIQSALLHVGAALLVGALVVPPAMAFVISLQTTLSTLVSIFAIGFPSIVYSLLAGVWIIKLSTGVIGGLRH
jgi:hypothetical protein